MKWTEEANDRLREMVALRRDWGDVAHALGCSYGAVKAQIHVLRLLKPPIERGRYPIEPDIEAAPLSDIVPAFRRHLDKIGLPRLIP